MKSTEVKFFTFKQVSDLTGIALHTLKFWCKEFKLCLKQSSSGRRIFTQQDVDKILLIKHLRQQERLTLSGIKQRIRVMKEIPKSKAQDKTRQNLLWLQKELLTIKNILQSTTINNKKI